MLRYAVLNFELKHIINRLQHKNENIIVDYAVENVTLSSSKRIYQKTKLLIDMIPKNSICALKMSSFGSKESPIYAYNHINKLIEYAKLKDICVCIDAEDVLYPNLCYSLMLKHNKQDSIHVYNTYQMYCKNGINDMICDINKAKKDNIMIGIKLVRGAYLKTQNNLFDKKYKTDNQYNKAIDIALTTNHAHTIIATHNKKSLDYILNFNKKKYVTAQLLGMGKSEGQIDYRYIAVGTFFELIPYLIRRLHERFFWE
tara:strand:- start:138 stop:908 length:771 start_codon:yes stop_codon:yes gene_type:complete